MMRRILLAVLACAAAAATACSSDEPAGDLPAGAGLLEDASATTAKIESAHFTLTVNGEVPGLDVRSAEGDLTREGDGGAAKGTVSMNLLGQLFEGEFVLVEDKVWIKGPTGDHQELPASMVANLYDPGAILDPERGVAKVLAEVQEPVTEGEEDIDGDATYRVKGKVAKDVVASLVPGIDSDVDITFWVLKDGDHRPVKASVAVPADGDPTVDVTLTDVGKQVDITPPV
ncbi:LppX_LprAFG lipoprotein [Actinophytocola sediminis]